MKVNINSRELYNWSQLDWQNLAFLERYLGHAYPLPMTKYFNSFEIFQIPEVQYRQYRSVYGFSFPIFWERCMNSNTPFAREIMSNATISFVFVSWNILRIIQIGDKPFVWSNKTDEGLRENVQAITSSLYYTHVLLLYVNFITGQLSRYYGQIAFETVEFMPHIWLVKSIVGHIKVGRVRILISLFRFSVDKTSICWGSEPAIFVTEVA